MRFPTSGARYPFAKKLVTMLVNESSSHHPLCRQTVTGFRPEDRHGNPVQVSNIQPPEINIEGLPTTRESSAYADTR